MNYLIIKNITTISYQIKLETNSNYMILWNHWIKKKSLQDSGDKEYKNMTCIESAIKYMLNPIILLFFDKKL